MCTPSNTNYEIQSCTICHDFLNHINKIPLLTILLVMIKVRLFSGILPYHGQRFLSLFSEINRGLCYMLYLKFMVKIKNNIVIYKIF